MCPTLDEDAVYLGSVLEQPASIADFSSYATSSERDEFERRAKEVLHRCQEVDLIDWECKQGIRLRAAFDAPPLDPRGDIESNWSESLGVQRSEPDVEH